MPPRRTLLEIDGHVVAADVQLRDDGRPPVLFLHGILATLELAPELFVDPEAESWIALSLPGHAPGRLPPGRLPRLDVDLFGQLVETALDRLIGTQTVIATGWSTGGFAALTLAIRHPRRVAAVATFAGFAGGRLTGSIGWLTWLAEGWLGAAGVRAGLTVAAHLPPLQRLFMRTVTADSDALARAPAHVLARLEAAVAAHDPRAVAAVLAAIRRLDITARLGEIRVPAWIVGGDGDPLIPAATTRAIAAAIPGATLRLYPDAGHLFFCEWPGFREDFAAWRRSLPGPGSAPATMLPIT